MQWLDCLCLLYWAWYSECQSVQKTKVLNRRLVISRNHSTGSCKILGVFVMLRETLGV